MGCLGYKLCLWLELGFRFVGGFLVDCEFWLVVLCWLVVLLVGWFFFVCG